jgi:RNAse (barnase) inhibitor barstar
MNTYLFNVTKKEHFDIQFEAKNIEEAKDKFFAMFSNHIETEEPYGRELDIMLECENEKELWIKL